MVQICNQRKYAWQNLGRGYIIEKACRTPSCSAQLSPSRFGWLGRSEDPLDTQWAETYWDLSLGKQASKPQFKSLSEFGTNQ